MSENPSAPPPLKNGNGQVRSKLLSPKFLWPAAAVLSVLLYFGLATLVNVFTHESTDDAFIAGHIMYVAPRVASQVVNVPVHDNELVHSNDLLVELDPTGFATTVAQKEAAVASQLANFQTLVAAYQLMRTKIATAEASARKARADAAAAEATATKSQLDFNRAQDLFKQKTVSQSEFDTARAANDEAQADWKSAVETAAVENSKIEEANEQLTVVMAQKDMALAQFNESQTNVAAAKLNLSYTKIFAPCDGRVTSKSVETGDYFDAGQQFMSLVPEEVWVVANFKESQLQHMQPGQRVTVAIDALGGQEFFAHVDSIQAGSGAAFSLLPPENATGNFVKVVQRVPVKIVFDEPLPAGHVIGPGMSVTPDVQVSKFALPAWAIWLAAIIVAALSAFVFVAVAGRRSGGK